jgi:ankyrin repeat protein
MFAPRFAGDLDLAQMLVDHGAAVGGHGGMRSPLAIAVQKGYSDYARVLLDAKGIVPATLAEALAEASNRDDFETALALLAVGADPNQAPVRTPLLCRAVYSAERRSLAIALLQHGADASASCDPTGRTPLFFVEGADHELVDLLLARGARLGLPQNQIAELEDHGLKASALIWALLNHRDYLASKLLARGDAGNDCGAVVYAARFGASLTLGELLRLGGDPNSTSEGGISALMAAAYHGQTDTVELLLRQPHIDPNQATTRHLYRQFFTIQLEGSQPPFLVGGRSALMFSVLGGSVETTKALLEHGADPRQRDAEGTEANGYSRSAAISRLLVGASAP